MKTGNITAKADVFVLLFVIANAFAEHGMKKIENTTWLIMSKDRILVAKGTPRNRHMVKLQDHIDGKDKKRLLSYSTYGKALSAIKTSGFYGFYKTPREEHLEPVEVKTTMEFE